MNNLVNDDPLLQQNKNNITRNDNVKDEFIIEQSQEFSSRISSAKEKNRNNKQLNLNNPNSNPNDLSHDLQFNQIVNMRDFRENEKMEESEKRSVISDNSDRSGSK